jgi:putative hydrolase of the HAD superfamily
MYDTILTDYFGVIDSSRYDSWLARHGYTRSGEFADLSNLTDEGRISMQQFFDGLGRLSGLSSDSIKNDFDEHAAINVELLELLKSLKGKYKIVLVSNASGHYLREILKRYNLEPIFDEIIISGEIGIIKPNREIFDYALDRAGTTAEKAIFIDDHEFNTVPAEGYGIKAVLYRGMGPLRAELKKLGVL